MEMADAAVEVLMAEIGEYKVTVYSVLNRKLERSKKIEMVGGADEVLMADTGEHKVMVYWYSVLNRKL